MLIDSPRITARDRETWAAHERVDAVHAQRRALRDKEARAIDAMREFAARGPCYVGVSWGKDSTVVAHLACRLAADGGPRLPIVWVRREPIDNPECHLVRDAFARMFPEADMHEVRIDCEYDPAHPQCWWRKGDPRRTPDARPKQQGFAEVARRWGERYVSGVRAAESGARVARMRAYGVSTERTCAPIGWWSTADVFAHLYRHGLPVHPAYALTAGGLYQRDRLRVGSIGSHHGQGHGRADWERRYYPEIAGLTGLV